MPRGMRFEAFIFNWVGHETRAAALERQLGALCPVRVINSESAAERRYPMPWVYDRRKLRAVDTDLYEVPQTDCTCWAISREVLSQVPAVDPALNKFGWGIDFLVMGAARALQRVVVRDYRYTIDHAWRGSGYDVEAADRLGKQPWPRRLQQAVKDAARAVRR